MSFQNVFDRGRVSFLAKQKSEKAKHSKICLSFGGSMPEAQFKRCPLTHSPNRRPCCLTWRSSTYSGSSSSRANCTSFPAHLCRAATVVGIPTNGRYTDHFQDSVFSKLWHPCIVFIVAASGNDQRHLSQQFLAQAQVHARPDIPAQSVMYTYRCTSRKN